MIAFRFEDVEGNVANDPRALNFILYYELTTKNPNTSDILNPWDSLYTQIELENCQQEKHFKNFPQQFKDSNHQESFCFDFPFWLGGFWDSSYVSNLELQVIMCTNTTEITMIVVQRKKYINLLTLGLSLFTIKIK